MIENTANSILRALGPTAPPSQREMVIEIFQRHSEYNIRRARAIDIERKQSYDFDVIQNWYREIHKN